MKMFSLILLHSPCYHTLHGYQILSPLSYVLPEAPLSVNRTQRSARALQVLRSPAPWHDPNTWESLPYIPGLHLNIWPHFTLFFPYKKKKNIWFTHTRTDVRTLGKRGENSFDTGESQGHLGIHSQDARTAAGTETTPRLSLGKHLSK